MKNVTVSNDVWKRLVEIRRKNNLKNNNEVIKALIFQCEKYQQQQQEDMEYSQEYLQ